MKKKSVISLFLILSLVAFALSLTSCDISNPIENFDNENITPVVDAEGYYTDSVLAFCTEIRGSYKSDRPFTLDDEKDNLRVWDDMYLYEGDYFQMIVIGSSDIFYSVEDDDLEYVELNESRAQATVKEGKSGIYRIVFDLTEKVFDLEYKGEITTPVYEKMDGCDVYSLSTEFTPLTENPNNSEELMIADYHINSGEVISFYNHGNVHLSNYKVILDASNLGKYATALEDGDKHITFAIGGIYNLYVNPTTYLVRVELTDPDTADYSLMVYKNGEPQALIAESSDTPYLFKYTVSLRKYASLPIFVADNYSMYSLSLNPSDNVDAEDGMFMIEGTYLLEIDLKSFTVTATYLPQ